MLESLRTKPSPLFHNADLTEETLYPFKSLQVINPDFFINEANLKQLIRAWYGLFGSQIGDHDILLTVDKPIFDHLSDEWDNLNNNGLPEKTGIICPFLKDKTKDSNNINISGDIGNIMASDIKPEDKIAALKKVASDFQSVFSDDATENHIIFSIRFFTPPEDAGHIKNDPFLKFLSGRFLVLAETHV